MKRLENKRAIVTGAGSGIGNNAGTGAVQKLQILPKKFGKK